MFVLPQHPPKMVEKKPSVWKKWSFSVFTNSKKPELKNLVNHSVCNMHIIYIHIMLLNCVCVLVCVRASINIHTLFEQGRFVPLLSPYIMAYPYYFLIFYGAFIISGTVKFRTVLIQRESYSCLTLHPDALATAAVRPVRSN